MATRRKTDLTSMAKLVLGTSPTNKEQIAQSAPTASSTIRAGGAIQKTPMVSQPRVAGISAVVGSTPSTGTVATRRTATTARKPKGPAMPMQASPIAMKKKLAVRKKLAQKGLDKRSKRMTKRIGG